ncbi:MAG TPA: allophanate hydrolase [Casimicrobiaceae bacterium]
MTPPLPATLSALHQAYRLGECRPSVVVENWLQRSVESRSSPIWICTAPAGSLRARARALDEMLDADASAALASPVFGALLAVKDNIDVAGFTTTAACPAFSYMPPRSAFVVDALERAGAIVVGKTNLDQFATGLVGTRSPYGAVPNAFDPACISGGSSSGSAVAVALGFVHLALGTDTAGSGRVPAALNNIVGWKPTRGITSMRGVVPACRSLDCVSIFALTVPDAARAFAIVSSRDPDRPGPSRALDRPRLGTAFIFAVPSRAQREFFGDDASDAAFTEAIGLLRSVGGVCVEIDFAPWRAVAETLYEGPRVAERHAAIRAFFDARTDALDPSVRSVISGALKYSATDAFVAEAELGALCNDLAGAWENFDVLVVPTVPRTYRTDRVAAEPIELNRRLGIYTNFVNLLDLAAIAVPATLRPEGIPFGITLIAPAGSDGMLADLAQRVHVAANTPLGALGISQPAPEALPPPRDTTQLAVVGAHLSGLPLNAELTSRGARLVRAARTAPRYRLYALPHTTPPKPGLVRINGDEGCAIEIEIWELPIAAFGAFVAQVPSPLAIGTLELEDGANVHGFVCESAAVEDAEDISNYGGWRGFLGARAGSQTSSSPSFSSP